MPHSEKQAVHPKFVVMVMWQQQRHGEVAREKTGAVGHCDVFGVQTIEQLVHGGDAASRQITLTTCYYYFHICTSAT